MDDPKGEALARELASQLAALLTPEPTTGTTSSRPTPGGPARGGLPSLAGPRTILENGSRFASPVLPADAPFRSAKALVLRALRIVTRDQTVFNSAVAEALRAGLSETEDALRDLASRAAGSEGEVRRLEAELGERLRDAAEALERLRGAQESLASARSVESLAAALGHEVAAREQATGAALAAEAAERDAALAREAAAREAVERDVLSVARRTDDLEDGTRRAAEALEREASGREALAREHHASQRRLDLLEALGERRDRALDREAAAREALSQQHHATQRRLDVAEALGERRDRALEQEASAREALAREHHATQRRLDATEALGERRERALEQEASAREALAQEHRATQRRLDVVEVRADELRPALAEAARRTDSLEAAVRELRARNEGLGEELRATRLEWSALRLALRGRTQPAAGDEPAPTAPAASFAQARPDVLSAGLYADFERVFRGDEAEIRRRQGEDAALFATAPGPVADLGCGRGELLETLRARGLAALGCDTNPVMVARCREKGLDVAEADLFTWLSAAPDGSLGGVTAYQVVEHLPAPALAPLVELAVAKLAPGGRLLVETVNPESVYAMRWFWMDLTHVRPVPGPSLAQLFSAAGLRDVEVRYRAEVPAGVSGDLSAVTDPVLAAAGRLLFAPQDVVVTGVR